MTTKTELTEFARKAFNNGSYYRQLYNCKAYMTNYNRFITLKSYNTIVAIYDDRTVTVYVLENYSTTTSQHVRKFCKYTNAMRLTKLYRDSTNIIEEGLTPEVNTYKLSSSEWKLVQERDFKGYIGRIED